MPAGSFANAASVGAKTVNGPGPLRVSTRPAALTAVTSVLNWPAPTAVSTMSWAAYAAWPATSAAAAAANLSVRNGFTCDPLSVVTRRS